MLDTLPPEVILHILSYLDLPELDALARVSPALRALAHDPPLHRARLLTVAPSRLAHALFAYGGALRPTVPDLVHWGVLRGLGFERRWRMGLYFNSRESVKQYEMSRRLQLTHVQHVLSIHLQRAPAAGSAARPAGPRVAPRLQPAARSLKWSLRRDELARRIVRDRPGAGAGGLLGWLEGRGRGLWKEGERVRLAICPGIGQFVRFYEDLAQPR